MNKFLRWLDGWWPLVWKTTYQWECQHTERMESQNWEHLDRINELLEEKSQLVLKIRELETETRAYIARIKNLEGQAQQDLTAYQIQRTNWMIETNSKEETIKSLRKFAQQVRFAFNLMTNPEQPTGVIDAGTKQEA